MFDVLKDIYEFLISPLSKFSRPCWSSKLNNTLEAIVFHWVESVEVRRPQQFECTAVEGVRSHFMFCVTSSGKIGRRWLSCYCKFCQSETWDNDEVGKRALGCSNLSTVGQWKLFSVRATDPRSYQENQKRCRERGNAWCIKASANILGLQIDTNSLPSTTTLIAFRSMNDSCGFSFWLGRLTESITRVN